MASSIKPSILFFHIDNVSQGDFGCYGGAFALGAKTPNIDQFADESLLLTNYKGTQLEEKFMEVKF